MTRTDKNERATRAYADNYTLYSVYRLTDSLSIEPDSSRARSLWEGLASPVGERGSRSGEVANPPYALFAL